eukprot:COSAG01_NODE_11786_length_1858_cov_102.098351_3_plen_74_part_00
MSDFLTKYHCILDYQSDRVGWSRLSMHAARCRSDRHTVQLMRLAPVKSPRDCEPRQMEDAVDQRPAAPTRDRR